MTKRARQQDGGARTRQVLVRLTETEYAALEKRAQEAGMTVSGCTARLLVERAASTEPVPSATGEPPLPIALINQLKRIGNNLNQLTHAANTGLPLDAHTTARTLRDLIATLTENELTSRRMPALKEPRTETHDPAPASSRNELQRRLRLHLARSGAGDDHRPR